MGFSDIYRVCKKSRALSRGLKSVEAELARNRISYIELSEVSIDCFMSISGYRLVTLEGVCFLPSEAVVRVEDYGLTRLRSIFSDADIVLPPYFSLGFLDPYASLIAKASDDSLKKQLGDELLADMYTFDSVGRLIDKWFSLKSFSEYNHLILESVEAFYFGLYGVAITGILPCIEGVVRKLGLHCGLSVEGVVNIRSLIKVFKVLQGREIEMMFDGYDWYPDREINIAFLDGFHERVQMLESTSSYFTERLYLHTDAAPDYLRLNRHGISHGLFNGYASRGNYLRLLNLLSALSFAAIMTEGVGSLFLPNKTPRSSQLTERFASCALAAAYMSRS